MGHFLCFVYCCWPHFVSAVLFQTVQETAGVGQPERDGLKIISSFLMKKKTSAEVCVHCRTFFSYLTQKNIQKCNLRTKELETQIFIQILKAYVPLKSF